MTDLPEILFEDSEIAVCIKPAGVLSEPGNGPSLPAMLKEYFAGKGLQSDIYTVHRLDAGTGGVMVYARTKKAAAALSQAITGGRFVKEYEALVHGKPPCDEGGTELSDYLLKDSTKKKVYVVKSLRKGVREARLVYTIKEERDSATLVRIRLITGRTHQIRVQFASRGYPLLGDGKYGARDGLKDIALCCVRIGFPHPSTGKIMNFEIESGL